MDILNVSHFQSNQIVLQNFRMYISKMNNLHPKAKTQILYVCDALYLQEKMSRVRFWVIEELAQQKDVNVIFTGPGFSYFDKSKSLQENIISFRVNFDLVMWYKPLNENYTFDKNAFMPFQTCLRYNEMWDEEWTRKEIDESNTNLIICHHYNDFLKYKEIYQDDEDKKFVYIPHCANNNVFRVLDVHKDIDILISGVLKEKHYPLKHRLYNLIKSHRETTLSQYNIVLHEHPSYHNKQSFQNVSQIEYNAIINRSKLCLACTSKHKYRLGKYVEIPMAGSVILGDLPFEDERFKDFVVEVNNTMSDTEILEIIKNTLNNPYEINEKRSIGLQWARDHNVDCYVKRFLDAILPKKIYIIADEIRENHPEFKNEKWICDILKKEFSMQFQDIVTSRAEEASIIWYLAPWNYRHIPAGYTKDAYYESLKMKKVIFTQHHIDLDKVYLGQLDEQFRFMRQYGTHYHSICDITKQQMKYYLDPLKTSTMKLWVNKDVFYPIKNKASLREKYRFDKKAYLVGSFQKDSEGQSGLPKLSKGPDLFIQIIKHMRKSNRNVQVVLSGLRREYIINFLEKEKIKYYYFNMVSMEKINELYNCLDLYVVCSRCEGGPRSIFEAGLSNTPIISTKVGIAPELMHEKALFDANHWESYAQAVPQNAYLHEKVTNLANTYYLNEFKDYLFLHSSCI